MITQNLTTCILFLLFLFPALYHSQGIERLDNTTDQLSLLSFKSQITYDPFGVLNTWNTNTSFCSWRGVSCNNTNQRVTSLILEDLNLAGTISPHIANLSFLNYLSLSNNSIYGILPPDLGRLFSLRNLTLIYNLINGTIPSSLSLCTRLITIDLRINRIEGYIPDELSGLSELQNLGLAGNFLTGRIPPSLGNLSSMTNLALSQNNLQGSIPKEIGQLPSLLALVIEQTNITGEIPPSVFNISSLIVLALAINNLSGNLPYDIFSTLPNLTVFYVDFNKFTGPIPSSLANASQLVRLDLGINSFTGRIPLLNNMRNIQILSMENNHLISKGGGGMGFISSLANSPQLRYFDVNSNRLTGELPPSIGNLSKVLSILYMGDNQFEGNIPPEISKLVGLTIISLGINSFTGNIPSSIGEMPILQRLNLYTNKLSGHIPESLGNLMQLYELRLNQNNLTGSIPVSLGNIQRLQMVDLSANMLNGTIPKEIFSILSLSKVLNLSSYSFTGSLPIDIGKLKMVQAIDLSMNHLSGEIPVSIGECLSLTVLNLSQNSFQGSIPDSLGNLRAIEYIDLSSNQLSGRIPSSLVSLKFMQVLNLSINQLEGDVPKEGIFNNSSVVPLDGNPNLCGGLPFLELPNCVVPEKHSSKTKVKLIVRIVLGFSVFSIFSCLFLLFLWKRTKSKPKVNEDIVSFEGPHRLYTYHDLRIATGNFNGENLIGEGSFGRVYKGILHDGMPAAVKVFNMEQHGALKSFLSECEALRNIRHRNLIKILSACSSSDFKALVLQFMSNGSLDQWLYTTDGTRLEFNTRDRLEVAKDVANALEYLHHDCETQVVHCDLKPSNILLDENMTAHVGDFGLARRLFNSFKEGHLSSTLGLKGSIGYIAPEYGLGGGVSPKGDVYSYGIVLLELFTGKKPTDDMFTGELDLQKWVGMAMPDHIMEIIDPELIGNDEIENLCLVSALKIGLACASKSPDERPTMRDVSSMLTSIQREQ